MDRPAQHLAAVWFVGFRDRWNVAGRAAEGRPDITVTQPDRQVARAVADGQCSFFVPFDFEVVAEQALARWPGGHIGRGADDVPRVGRSGLNKVIQGAFNHYVGS